MSKILSPSTICATSILFGMALYLSKFLRPYFAQDDTILFILGFMPNFGLAFVIPFIYVSNRLRQNKSVSHFFIVCVATLLLMSLNELRDKFQTERVFDINDVYASAAAVTFAYLIFYFTMKEALSIRNAHLNQEA